MTDTQDDTPTKEHVWDFAGFLESCPPGQTVIILNIFDNNWYLNEPNLQLHCNSDNCNGTRIFRCISSNFDRFCDESDQYGYLNYECKNCQKEHKLYPLSISENGDFAFATKIGEWPPFGPPVPPRVITLVRPDRELLIKGTRAENIGLGIGAFTYYRRVIEHQWQRLLDEIIRVAQTTNASPDSIKILKSAKNERQFDNAIKMILPAIPEPLRIKGHNPIRLLYSAVSEGIHNSSDQECLKLAQSIRTILYELSERIQQVLKDNKELNAALSNILNKRQDKNKK